jgi:hypothetical protein
MNDLTIFNTDDGWNDAAADYADNVLAVEGGHPPSCPRHYRRVGEVAGRRARLRALQITQILKERQS